MSKRNDRVSSLLHREVAGLLQLRMRDPRIEGLTVTRVEVSNDLHYAWVYVDFVSRQGNVDAALAALEKASRFIRNEVRQNLSMRHTPELIFRSDKGLEYSERIHNVLQELRERGELPADEAAAGQPHDDADAALSGDAADAELPDRDEDVEGRPLAAPAEKAPDEA
jgi:ribosome-binding factor A